MFMVADAPCSACINAGDVSGAVSIAALQPGGAWQPLRILRRGGGGAVNSLAWRPPAVDATVPSTGAKEPPPTQNDASLVVGDGWLAAASGDGSVAVFHTNSSSG
jgi:hypothetical protein